MNSRDSLKLELTATFLELGDATSRNLEFSHRKDVYVSYGEETITESNLLEIRRRHPQIVRIQTFTKSQESKKGADWEWRIVGKFQTLRMRVQAKRIQQNGILKIRHVVKSSGIEQRELLIQEAESCQMKPVYCIYCTEPQRNFWKQKHGSSGNQGFQYGCLLANACDVPLNLGKLVNIEEKCWPWHFVFDSSSRIFKSTEYLESEESSQAKIDRVTVLQDPIDLSGIVDELSDYSRRSSPNIDDLNRESGRREYDTTGVKNTTEEDLIRLMPDSKDGREIIRMDADRNRKSGIHRMVVMDVRSDL